MDLDHIILADSVVMRSDSKMDIMGAAWDTIVAENVPALHPQITIVIRVLLTPHEALSQHTVDLVLMGPDSQIGTATGRLGPGDPAQLQQMPPAEKFGVASVLNLQNIVFEKFGTYHIAAHWDGTELRPPLTFKVVPPPDADADASA